MITAIGSSNIDYVTYNKKLPVPGETVYGDSVKITAGGKGANQIAAASRLGAKTKFLTKIGDDNNSSLLTEALEWAGVDLSRIGIEKGVICGTAFIAVDEKAQNFITIIKGANEYITPDYIDKNKDVILDSKICMAEFGAPIDSVMYGISLAKTNNITTIVNPAPVVHFDESFYKDIDIIVLNEIESAELSDLNTSTDEGVIKSATFFHEKGVRNVVITLGSKGSFVSDGVRSCFVPSYKVDPVDTTGAGDSFIGGLAYALWKDMDLFEAANFATAVASISITKSGSMISMPSYDETIKFIDKNTIQTDKT